MSFLRRLFGGEREGAGGPERVGGPGRVRGAERAGGPEGADVAEAADESAAGAAAGRLASEAEADAAERDHEREVLRAEGERLDDLRRRQLRYASYAWTPPAQGGERRADDEDAAPEA